MNTFRAVCLFGILLFIAFPSFAEQGRAGPEKAGQGAQDKVAEQQRRIGVEYLQRIQESTYERMGRKPRFIDKAFFDEFSAKFLASPAAEGMSKDQQIRFLEATRKRIFENNLRSKYEDPLGFAIVENLNDRLKDALVRSSIKLEGEPVFGTLPTRQVNARTFLVEGTPIVVIAFEDQIFNFANLFSKAIALAFPAKPTSSGGISFSTAESDIQQHIESDPRVLKRFQEVLIAYLIEGWPGAAPQYFLGPPNSHVAEILRESMELFVLGHEYGHFMAGHLSEGRRTLAAIGDERVKELVRSWRDEIEADAYGLMLDLAAMKQLKVDTAMGYMGADFFFTSLDIVERALSVLRTGEEPPADRIGEGSHPPPKVRQLYLRAALKESIAEKAEGPVKLAATLGFTTDLLWERTKPMLVKAHRDGIRPHASWNH